MLARLGMLGGRFFWSHIECGELDMMTATPAVASAVVATISIIAVSRAQAQWTITNLHPAGQGGSVAVAVNGGQQVGYLGGVAYRASLWSGSAGSWVNLHPAGAESSFATCTSGSQQFGGATFGNSTRAGSWSGTAASWTELHPVGALDSAVYGAASGQQVGYAYIDHAARAGMWLGTPGSWTSLHPAGAESSFAYGAWGTQQVGSVVVGNTRASLWSGSAESWVDLHPAGWAASTAVSVWGDEQVGSITTVHIDGGGFPIFVPRATLWRGTAESRIDLHPAGAYASTVYGVWNGFQVGSAGPVLENQRAGMWRGSAASWEELPLPPSLLFYNSIATGVWSDGTTLFVSGYAFSPDDGSTSEALLWSRPVPAPGAGGVFAACGVLAMRQRRRRSCALDCVFAAR